MRTSAKEHDRIYARLLTHSHHRINMSRSWRIVTTENRWPFTSLYLFYTKLERFQCIWKTNVIRLKCALYAIGGCADWMCALVYSVITVIHSNLDVLTCCLYYHWFTLQNMSLTLHMCVRYAMYSSAPLSFVTVWVHARLGMNDGRKILKLMRNTFAETVAHNECARAFAFTQYFLFLLRFHSLFHYWFVDAAWRLESIRHSKVNI